MKKRGKAASHTTQGNVTPGKVAISISAVSLSVVSRPGHHLALLAFQREIFGMGGTVIRVLDFLAILARDLQPIGRARLFGERGQWSILFTGSAEFHGIDYAANSKHASTTSCFLVAPAPNHAEFRRLSTDKVFDS